MHCLFWPLCLVRGPHHWPWGFKEGKPVFLRPGISHKAWVTVQRPRTNSWAAHSGKVTEIIEAQFSEL